MTPAAEGYNNHGSMAAIAPKKWTAGFRLEKSSRWSDSPSNNTGKAPANVLIRQREGDE